MASRGTTVKKSRKDQGKCGRCGDALPAGSAYRYWMPIFRSKYKMVRCMKNPCTPKPSELDQSKTSTILAAQEEFAINQFDDADEMKNAVQEVAEAVREVADEYRDALDAWEHGNSRLEELADHYEDQATTLEDWEPEEVPDEPEDPEETGDEDEDAYKRDEWETAKQDREDIIESNRESAEAAVADIELM